MDDTSRENAFNLLYDESYEEMLKFMKGFFYWDWEEAYDVLQEVYLTAYEKIESLSEHEDISRCSFAIGNMDTTPKCIQPIKT